MKSINLQFNWREAMLIYMTALEHGTEEGKELARFELMKLADYLDNSSVITEKREELPAEKLAEPSKHFIIRKVN